LHPTRPATTIASTRPIQPSGAAANDNADEDYSHGRHDSGDSWGARVCQPCRRHRPELSAKGGKGDKGDVLSVPFLRDGYIQMQGRRVFHEAVRTMITSLTRVCSQQQLSMDQLDLIVPHQANQRILDAIQSRVRARVCSNIRVSGNTSSSSIPLCLAEVLPTTRSGDQLGLCAFGGGFTFGAGILRVN